MRTCLRVFGMTAVALALSAILGGAIAWWEATREGAAVRWILALPIVEVRMPLGGLEFAVYFEDYDGSRPRLYVHKTVYPFTPHWYLSYVDGRLRGEYCSSSLWPFSNPEKDCRILTIEENSSLLNLLQKAKLQVAELRKSSQFPYR